MKKISLIVISTIFSISVFSQVVPSTGKAQNLTATKTFSIGTKLVNRISTDSLLASKSDNSLVTEGAVKRYVDNVAGTYVNVKRFGAVGNGIANDAPALQAALNFAESTKRALYIPQGTYKINASINQQASTKVKGEGSIIKAGTADMTMWKVNRANNIGGGLLEGLEFDGNNGLADVGITYGKTGTFDNDISNATPGFVTKSVRVKYCGEAGIITGANFWLASFENCQFAHCGKAAWVNGLAGSEPNNENISFYNCAFYNSTIGLKISNYFSGGGSVFCYACSFDYNTDYSVSNGESFQTGQILALIGCHIESDEKYIINYGELSMVGCFCTNGSLINGSEHAILNYGYLGMFSTTVLRGGGGKSVSNFKKLTYLNCAGVENSTVTNETGSELEGSLQMGATWNQYVQNSSGFSAKVLGLNLRKITYGGAAPTTGYQDLGDIVFNNNVKKGANSGWICTTAGEAGTFVYTRFGFIDATGQQTFTGNGSTTVFNIPHTLDEAPTSYSLTPITAAAAGNYFVTATSTNLVVTFLTAPTNAAAITFKWVAKIL